MGGHIQAGVDEPHVHLRDIGGPGVHEHGTRVRGDSLKRKKTVPFIRSKAWKELREEALERDGHRCVLCGS